MFNLGVFLSFFFLFPAAVTDEKTCSSCSKLQPQPSFAFHILWVYRAMASHCSMSWPELSNNVPIGLGSSPRTGILSSEFAIAAGSTTWSWGAPSPGSSVVTGLL